MKHDQGAAGSPPGLGEQLHSCLGALWQPVLVPLLAVEGAVPMQPRDPYWLRKEVSSAGGDPLPSRSPLETPSEHTATPGLQLPAVGSLRTHRDTTSVSLFLRDERTGRLMEQRDGDKWKRRLHLSA